jgi:predicted nucleic acid-binding protein
MPDRIVIANSTPIIAFSSIHGLKLLKDLYGEVIIPKAVHDEVSAKNNSVSQQALA